MSDFWIGVIAASWFWFLVYSAAVVYWAIWGGKSRGGEMVNTEAANDCVASNRIASGLQDAIAGRVVVGRAGGQDHKSAPSAWRGLHTHTWADPT